MIRATTHGRFRALEKCARVGRQRNIAVCSIGMTTGEFFDWLLKVLVAFGTVGAVIFALFQDKWRKRSYHPGLDISAVTKPPDCVKILSVLEEIQSSPSGRQLVRLESASYYLRVLIENNGNETARNVEVYAKELNRKLEDGRWKRVSEFPPMNLIWGNSLPNELTSLFSPQNRRGIATLATFLIPRLGIRCTKIGRI
jgi:hypothetical protein